MPLREIKQRLEDLEVPFDEVEDERPALEALLLATRTPRSNGFSRQKSRLFPPKFKQALLLALMERDVGKRCLHGSNPRPPDCFSSML